MSTWRPIAGYEGYYEVSDDGQVRSLDRTVPHALYGEQSLRGRVLSRTKNTAGYLQVYLCRDNAPDKKDVHRLVLETFVGPCPEGMEGCHGDGDSANARLSNLRWKTATENAADRVRHGTQVRGSRTGRAVLVEGDAERILDLRATGFTSSAIAAHLYLPRGTVNNIFYGRSWRHVRSAA